MKVKIKKQGKKETYNTINSWSDVTLEKFAELTELSKGSKSKEAEETLAALSDMPRKLIKELSLRDVSIILGKMAELQEEQETILKKTIEIDGKE
jgi:molybdopterin converting factor small subunit